MSEPSGVQVTYKTPVVGMKDNGDSISVQFANGNSAEYSAVFNTTALGCLGRMDLSGLKLPLGDTLDKDPLTAIRSLAYDRATKVAIKFSKPLWTTAKTPIPTVLGLSTSPAYASQPGPVLVYQRK